MKIIVFLLCFTISLLSGENEVKVIGVKDGDTIEVIDTAIKQTYTIRLSEVDAPEKSQPFGQKAKQMTSELVYGKFVKVESIGKDRNGRTIAKVFYNDSIYLSETLIRTGMAWVYRKYSKNAYLIQLETISRKNKTGLWIDENAIEPCVWRKQRLH